MHREQTKARTRTAQAAAGALLLGAVAVVAVPGGILSSGVGEATQTAAVASTAGAGVAMTKPVARPTDSGVDSAGLAKALDKIAPPLPPARAKEPVPGPGGEPPPPPPPPPAQWRYIGVVLGQARASHRAIVTVNEQQSLVAEGQQVDGDKVDEIHDAFMLVTNSAGVQRRVDMAVQAKPQLVVARNSGVPAAAVAPAEAVDDQDARALALADGTVEGGELARSMGLSEEVINGYPPKELSKVLESLLRQAPGGKFELGDGSAPKAGERGSIDALRLLQRQRIQALDDAFHNGSVTAAEYKERMERLSEVSSKGTPEEQSRALEQLIEDQLGPRQNAGGEPK